MKTANAKLVAAMAEVNQTFNWRQISGAGLRDDHDWLALECNRSKTEKII